MVNWRMLRRTLGFNMLLLSWALVVILFIKAFFSTPISLTIGDKHIAGHAVFIFINNFYEMYIELAAVILSFVFVPWFVIELKKEGIIKFFGGKDNGK